MKSVNDINVSKKQDQETLINFDKTKLNDYEMVESSDSEIIVEVNKYNIDNIDKLKNNFFVLASTIEHEKALMGDMMLLSKTFKKNHIVKPMENIYDISQKYDISIDEIIQKNELKTKKLFIGQHLKI